MPVSSEKNEERQLYFWYFPSYNPASNDEITIWLNGGPGASSLGGLLQENGPFLWQYGTLAPVPNPWTWVNLTNMLWVESPVGTGFTQGPVTAISERDVARDFLGFFKNFVDTFDLPRKKIYITGESYAGMYIPYLADEMLNANDSTYFGLEGTMMYDPLVNNNAVMRQVPAVAFANYWKHLLGLNQTFMDHLNDLAVTCGYTTFLQQNLVYPSNGPLASPPGGVQDIGGDCDVWGSIVRAAVILNPVRNLIIFQVEKKKKKTNILTNHSASTSSRSPRPVPSFTTFWATQAQNPTSPPARKSTSTARTSNAPSMPRRFLGPEPRRRNCTILPPASLSKETTTASPA